MIQQSKEVYCNSSKDEVGIPIFHQPEWLDIACEHENWEVITWHLDNQIVGALPYRTGKKFVWNISLMPPLTPYLGLWINPKFSQQIKQSKINGKIEQILDKLSDNELTSFRNIPAFAGNLSWIWKNWELDTRFTYLIYPNDFVSMESLDGKLRNDVKKAQSNLTVSTSSSIDELFQVVEQSFKRNQQKLPFSLEKLQKFHSLIQEKKWGEILVAKDKSGNVVAANYFLWDKHMKYNWLSGYTKSEVSRGAVQLLLFEGLRSAQSKNKIFDFEGGVIPGIGAMFKSFPVKEVPVLTARKFKNKWIKALWSLR